MFFKFADGGFSEFVKTQLTGPGLNLNLRPSTECQDATFDVVYGSQYLEPLSDPGKSLDDVYRVMKPKGRLLLQEVNLQALTTYPHCTQLEGLCQKLIMLRAVEGGDAILGKKLFYFVKRAGFKEISLTLQGDVHWSGTPMFEKWVHGLVEMIQEVKKPLIAQALAKDTEIKGAIDEVKRLLTRDDCAIYFYWNRATATKPVSLRQ